MGRTNIKNLRYVQNYYNAPKSAEYIVRILADDSVILEHYNLANSAYPGTSETISEFEPFNPFDKESYIETLRKCREIVNEYQNNKVIYCEWPPFFDDKSYPKADIFN